MTAMTLTVAARGTRSLLEPVPHGRTARRLDWQLLPPMTRRLVEERFGTTVVKAVSAGAGLHPRLASVLTGADGAQMFLKAASKKAQRPFADAYREEIRKLRGAAVAAAGPAAAVEPRGRPVGAARPGVRRRPAPRAALAAAPSSTPAWTPSSCSPQTLTPPPLRAGAPSPRTSRTS